jgi:magnesium-transporting ATPase (P-type)
LHELGIRTAMITGDNERTARFVAAQVGIAIDAADVTLVSGYVQSRTAKC